MWLKLSVSVTLAYNTEYLQSRAFYFLLLSSNRQKKHALSYAAGKRVVMKLVNASERDLA